MTFFLRSRRTLMPSAAPTARSQLAKPKALPPLYPAPLRASRVASVPASGLLIWRTIAASLFWSTMSQSNTPWSVISFQMAP